MNSDIARAVILAAGEGTRMRPLTLEKPKVLLPVGEVPLIMHTLAWLKSHGIQEVFINLHYMGDKIRQSLGDGSRFGVGIRYSPEEKLLGTAGGIKRMERFLDTSFVVVYGDVLTDFDLSAMIDFHKTKGALATLALVKVPHPGMVGVVDINSEGRLLSFREKPPRDVQLGNLVSGGIYVLDRAVLDHIPSEGSCDFGYDIFPQLIELGFPVYGYRLKNDDYLIDIGTLEKYDKANEDMKAGKVKSFVGSLGKLSRQGPP